MIHRQNNVLLTDADGNPSEWYEVADTRRAVADLRRLTALAPQDRADLASLVGSARELERLYAAGRYTEAQTIAKTQLEIRRRVLGDDHPDTLNWITNVGAAMPAASR